MTVGAAPAPGEGFPPAHHMLRDLDFDVRAVDVDRHVARFTPGGGDGGPTELGALTTVVDLLAGTLCLGAIAPDWMATSGLTLHLAGPPPAGDLIVAAHIVRAGRTTVAVEVDVCGAGTDEPFAEGMVTFSRLVRRETNLSLEGAELPPGTTFSFTSEHPDRVGAGGSLGTAISCEVLDASAGVTETPIDGYVRNSFGAINGGAVATIVDTAARAWAGAQGGSGTVTDLVVHYLSQGRVGPVRTSVRAVRDGRSAGTLSTVRVEVTDAGAAEDRVMVVAHVGLSGAPAG